MSLTLKSKKKHRILFFDLLKIASVLIIVYAHSPEKTIPYSVLFPDGFFYNIYPLSLALLAVYVLIFVSGAVMEYNYSEIHEFSEYIGFLFKRFIRLYPAFWVSLIIGIILFPAFLIHTSIVNIIWEFTGFYIFTGQGAGVINRMGWFIGTIFVLYMLFPVLSKTIRKYPTVSLLSFMAVSFLSRYVLLTTGVLPYESLYRCLPICNLFEFGLGIYLIQNNFYPKNTKNHLLIGKISDFMFYILIFHFIFINTGATFVVFHDALLTFIVCTISVSLYMMVIDDQIRKYISVKMRSTQGKDTIEENTSGV